MSTKNNYLINPPSLQLIFNLGSKTRFLKKPIGFLAVFMMLCSVSIQAQQETTIGPTYDAYLQNGALYNNEVLYLEKGSRTRKSYLLFDLNGISGSITELELTLTVFSDDGTGPINVIKGNGDNWNETNLASNTPSEGGIIGSFTAPFNKQNSNGDGGSVKTLSIPVSNISSNGFLTLILVNAGSNGNDLNFVSNGPNLNSTSWVLAPESKRPKLKVTYTPTPTTVAVSNVTVSPTSASIEKGNTQQLTPTISPSNATNTSVSWSSSNSSVATVNSNGLVTGVAAGSAQITVTTADGNKTASSAVTVTNSNTGGGTTGGGTTGGYWTKTGNNVHYTTGNVGIGITALNSYKLAVDGNIRAREIKVDNDSWADYVFEKNYKLPTLEEVANHIQEKGHLINMPSATEVKANGIELGEMNKLLLEKIEELTLYTIQQQKQIEALQQLVKTQK